MLILLFLMLTCSTYWVIFSFDYVNQNIVNMHALPREASEVVSQAIYGTDIAIIEQQGEWRHIQTPDGYRGWVHSQGLIHRGKPYGRSSNSALAKVNSLFVHVYHESDITVQAPMITLAYGTLLEIHPGMADARWIKATLLNGQTAWVQKGDLILDPKSITLKEMITLSERFLGLPYTWGGVSSFGFDCSGFVQMLYAQMGIILPRDSSLQIEAQQVKPVDFNLLQSGDLLFFGPQDHKVTHVGLYLGESKFIHAKAKISIGSPTVQISDLQYPNYEEKFIGARRIVL
jgi:gamma-D-glutamyl-L-lysine dipeptidyl-peptidase